MTAFLLYNLKVIVCAGILFLYYLVALRNKRFHQWNRFYLLAAVVISLVAPLLRFTVTHQAEANHDTIQILQAVESTNGYLEEITVTNTRQAYSDNWAGILYMTISGVLFLGLLFSLYRIWSIVRSHTNSFFNNIRFVSTNVKGTPFSFLHYIFWNDQIDIQTATGQQIFQHELVHVKEKHTIDQLFMRVVLIFSWGNPFFWLIRRELKMVHEFIADKKSVAEHGTAALAAMILQASYPSQFNSLTSQYFQTSIKRRIHMLTQIKNPGLNYFSRVLALPIIALTVLAFTVRSQSVNTTQKLDHQVTVVIDAGHGMQDGKYTGAISNYVYEDEIALLIAQKIAALNQNGKINIILTRKDQSLISLQERVDIAKQQHADLFISLHLNAFAENNTGSQLENSGMDIVIPNKNPGQLESSKLLASAIASEISSVYRFNNQLHETQSVYVLNNSTCPAVLLECGYVTDQRDREFISKQSNQELIARKILAAIEAYSVNRSQ